MCSAIGLRDDFDGPTLRRLARLSKSANQARRLLTLAQIYDGGNRSEADRIGGVTLQIVRDWVIRFNARGHHGLLDGKTSARMSDMRSLAEWQEFSRNEAKPSFAAGLEPWRLPTQTRTFLCINGDVCFRRKRSGRFCDRHPNPLMIETGSVPRVRLASRSYLIARNWIA